MLQRPLSAVISPREMETALDNFWDDYRQAHSQQMLNKLGFSYLPSQEAEEIISLTLQFLVSSRLNYHQFFREISGKFSPQWREDAQIIFSDLMPLILHKESLNLASWCKFYHYLLVQKPETELVEISQRLTANVNLLSHNLKTKTHAVLPPRSLVKQAYLVSNCCKQYNSDVVILDAYIARIWDNINEHNNWDLFKTILQQIQ